MAMSGYQIFQHQSQNIYATALSFYHFSEIFWLHLMGPTLIALHLPQISIIHKIERVVVHRTALPSVHSYFISGFEGSTACAATYMYSHLMDFMIPEGKSYLANAGLALCNALLIPYQGVHFHLEKGWSMI
jgi:hypothetical protein